MRRGGGGRRKGRGRTQGEGEGEEEGEEEEAGGRRVEKREEEGEDLKNEGI